MSNKERLYAAGTKVLGQKGKWNDSLSTDAEFKRRGGVVYPYDTLSANLDPIFALFEKFGLLADFEDGKYKRVCDIGCANGDLSFALAEFGCDVVAVDYSFGRDQAPYIVSKISEQENYRIAVVDTSVDRSFGLNDLVENKVSDKFGILNGEKLDLVICVGVLYHLQNPFAFMKSLLNLSDTVIVGTHIITHTPALKYDVSDFSMSYLVDARELNNDPTNYWMLTEKAFKLIATRSGFDVLGSILLPNNTLSIGVPDRVDMGVRCFLALQANKSFKELPAEYGLS